MDTLENDPLRLVGTVLAEKYLVEALVAEGGYSLVYRARHQGWGQPCVLKLLKGIESMSPGKREALVASLVREGSILRELSSRAASILQAHDLGTWVSPEGEAYPYLVLEWLEGTTLAEAVALEQAEGRPPLALAELMPLFDPVARALAEAHRRGIAHRDLKPENLFVCGMLRGPDCLIKVLDFGVAKLLLDAGAQPKNTGLSSQASFTPWYGAPEQFSNNHGSTGPWTDVFALALILVEMLTFQRGLSGDDVLALAVEALHPSQRPSPRNKGAVVPDEVEAVFLRALSVRSAERPQNIGEFWSELRRAVGMEPLESTTFPSASLGAGSLPGVPRGSILHEPTLREGTAPGAPPRWLWGVIGGASLVLVAGGALLLGMKLSRPASTPAASAPPALSSAPVRASASAPPPPACPAGMARIPGGEFFMGYEGEGALDQEKPVHSVKLDGFCIDITEVTVEQYRSCSGQGRCRRALTEVRWPQMNPLQKRVYSPLCNIDDAGRDRHPINCVTWEMADEYCRAQGWRLPTSAEWEFAVRGPDGRTYPWGNEPPDANHLNACGKECIDWGRKNGVAAELFAMHSEDDSFPTTAPVGSFPRGRSRYGLDDVIGNVMEWVQDWNGPYSKDPKVNPGGPAQGTERVIRGGAWNAGHMVWVRPSFRFQFPPDVSSHGIGFRCAASLVSQR
jgi:formylglycine-generating enzyme required for sulfatase activity